MRRLSLLPGVGEPSRLADDARVAPVRPDDRQTVPGLAQDPAAVGRPLRPCQERRDARTAGRTGVAPPPTRAFTSADARPGRSGDVGDPFAVRRPRRGILVVVCSTSGTGVPPEIDVIQRRDPPGDPARSVPPRAETPAACRRAKTPARPSPSRARRRNRPRSRAAAADSLPRSAARFAACPARSVTNAYWVLTGEAAGSNSLRVLLRNGRSGEPSSGTSTRSKSVDCESNAIVAPIRRHARRALVAGRGGERGDGVRDRVRDPQMRAGRGSVGSRQDEMPVVRQPAEARRDATPAPIERGSSARGSPAGMAISKKPVCARHSIGPSQTINFDAIRREAHLSIREGRVRRKPRAHSAAARCPEATPSRAPCRSKRSTPVGRKTHGPAIGRDVRSRGAFDDHLRRAAGRAHLPQRVPVAREGVVVDGAAVTRPERAVAIEGRPRHLRAHRRSQRAREDLHDAVDLGFVGDRLAVG